MGKVFCIGSNKTGTTSLKSALIRLGFNVASEQKSYSYISKVENKQYKEIFDLVNQYDAFEDRPWNHTDFYKILDKQFEDSKFILTIRNVDLWWESYLRWNEKVKLTKQIYYPLISKICYNVDSFLDYPDQSKKMYLERNQNVINYFMNKTNLLIMDISKTTNYDELCVFLNKKKIPDPFPHHNKTL